MMKIGKQIINLAIENTATVAGIASTRALQISSSHSIFPKLGDNTVFFTTSDKDILPKDQLFRWPKAAQSVLVIGLSHPEDQPELDWWDGKGTPGNRRLIEILNSTRHQIEQRLHVNTWKLPYHIEKGGIFLKDAAVLAGLGVIGLNNMVVTPDWGPRIRLRALFLDADVEPIYCEPFLPCTDCSRPCRSVCPQYAMDKRVPAFDTIDASVDLPGRDGSYDRKLCNIQMERDEAAITAKGLVEPAVVKYCRLCEFACPVGKK